MGWNNGYELEKSLGKTGAVKLELLSQNILFCETIPLHEKFLSVSSTQVCSTIVSIDFIESFKFYS
jgi:hypothetical protein